MGHDWGGLISYSIALRENSRVERLMPLNIIHPWPSQPALLRNLPKSIYAYRNAFGVGTRPMRDAPERFSKTMDSDLGRTSAISDADLRIYVGSLSLPGREHVTTMVYRDFMTREVFALGFGRYSSRRLTMPTLVLFGEGGRHHEPAPPGGLPSPRRRHARGVRAHLRPFHSRREA